MELQLVSLIIHKEQKTSYQSFPSLKSPDATNRVPSLIEEMKSSFRHSPRHHTESAQLSRLPHEYTVCEATFIVAAIQTHLSLLKDSVVDSYGLFLVVVCEFVASRIIKTVRNLNDKLEDLFFGLTKECQGIDLTTRKVSDVSALASKAHTTSTYPLSSVDSLLEVKQICKIAFSFQHATVGL
ncbi:hypothetical protein Naga_100668g2 [Nannochloropsis gaditana]|uniref:Uncharacterized protein n=1 Tax=Nannochloropsis gaditana TaxID=72520 RepID=W7U1F1_9STRA|nr:hypothetical protein Naga_100668g2 [Nannochloropsis gaditana]